MVGASNIYLLQNIQTGSGAHPTFCSVGPGFFPWVKQPGHVVNQSASFGASVKNE